jgi:hypothetical protein
LLNNNDIVVKQPLGIVINRLTKNNITNIVIIMLVSFLVIFFFYLNFIGCKAKAYKLADEKIKDYTYFFKQEFSMNVGEEKEIIFPKTKNKRKIKIQYIKNEINNCFKDEMSCIYLRIDAWGDVYMTEEVSEDHYQFKFLCTNDVFYDDKYLMFFKTNETETLNIIHVCPRHVNMNTNELSLIVKYWRVFAYDYER